MSLRCQRAFLRSLYAVRAFSTANLSEPLRKRIESYVASAPVVVFMKGTQQEPMCGFSRNVKLVRYNVFKFADNHFAINIAAILLSLSVGWSAASWEWLGGSCYAS